MEKEENDYFNGFVAPSRLLSHIKIHIVDAAAIVPGLTGAPPVPKTRN